MARAAAALGGMALIGAAAVAQPAATPSPTAALDWLAGRWTGSGTVHGMPSEATLEVAPALAGRFVELRYRFATRGARPVAFEGRGLYRADGAGWRGQWLDSTGAIRPLSGIVSGTTLTSNWGDTASEQGRSSYRRDANGALEATDEVLRKDGRWHVFATHRFTLQR